MTTERLCHIEEQLAAVRPLVPIIMHIAHHLTDCRHEQPGLIDTAGPALCSPCCWLLWSCVWHGLLSRKHFSAPTLPPHSKHANQLLTLITCNILTLGCLVRSVEGGALGRGCPVFARKFPGDTAHKVLEASFNMLVSENRVPPQGYLVPDSKAPGFDKHCKSLAQPAKSRKQLFV